MQKLLFPKLIFSLLILVATAVPETKAQWVTATNGIAYNAGRVGIQSGTGWIGAVLDVHYPGGTVNLYRATDQSGQFRWRIDQGFDLFLTNSSGTDVVKLSDAGDNYITSGDLGIYETDPCRTLHLNEDVPAILFQDDVSLSGKGMYVRGGPGAYLSMYWADPACDDGTERFRFDSDGDAYKKDPGDWSGLSDARLKKDVRPFTDGLEVLRQIDPVWYKFKGEYVDGEGEQDYVGVIAQDIREAAPYTVSENQIILPGGSADTDADNEYMDVLTYNGSAVRYIIVNAIKELDTKVNEVSSLREQLVQSNETIQSLQEANTNLRSELSELRSMVEQLAGQRGFEFDGANTRGAVLYQNSPNPFHKATSIRYFIPEMSQQAEIVLSTVKGSIVRSFELHGSGHGSVEIHAGELRPGTYVYSLTVDGNNVDTKKMILMD